MPEGPEVLTMAKGLHTLLEGSTLTSVEIVSGKYTKKEPEGWNRIRTPAQLQNVGCRGKLLYMAFQKDGQPFWLFSGMGMTGSWLTEPKQHTRIILRFENRPLYFNDPRNFGNLSVVASEEAFRARLEKIAPPLLGPEALSETEFLERAEERQKRSPSLSLAKVLMDQSKICSGIGNYLLAEILYHARIDPFATLEELDRSDWTRLFQASRELSLRSYQSKGATIRDYRQVDGKVGEFEFIVYQRSTDPEGRKVVSEPGPHGRTIWWVPEVQEWLRIPL